MSTMDGRVIGGFRVVKELKGGAQGTIYKAVCIAPQFDDCPPGTVVALKTMPVRDDGSEQFKRLERRTRELAALKHRNIVRYFGCFQVQETFAELHVVVLEYLDGETLKEVLARCPGGLDVDISIKVVGMLLSALAAAQELGICHRDVKPANIFLCRNGDVKLIDFEVAHSGGGQSSTGTEQMIGTFDYMAPDFTATGFRGDYCSDVFSVGVVMHEVLTGRVPYRRGSHDGAQADFVFMSRWARGDDGTFLSNPIAVSSKVNRLLAHADEVLLRAMAPDRVNRFADFNAFSAALRNIRFRDLLNGNRAYRILQLVGKGGFGEVFKARVRGSGQLVAVKHLLKPDYAARFQREAKIMSQLNGSCFVRFVDFFMVDHAGSHEAFLIMDYLDGMPGSSLKDAIRAAKGKGLSRTQVLHAFARYAHGLSVLHTRGIYHRDIKPANLYYPSSAVERCAIMDFGIARDVNGTATTGGVPGTFDYMPPEVVTQQTRGESGMDIYALGLCLYEALTGKTAYPKLPPGAAAYSQFFQRARTMAKPDLSASPVVGDLKLLSLIREMTNPDVQHRLLNTAEVERRLWNLAGIESPFAPIEVEDDATTVSEADVAPTQRTVFIAPKDLKKISRTVKSQRNTPPTKRRLPMRLVVAIVTLAVIGSAGYVFRGQITNLANTAIAKVEEYRQQRAKDAEREAARIKAKLLDSARKSANAAAENYDSDFFTVTEVDSTYKNWCREWTNRIDTAEYESLVAKFEKHRKSRLDKDNEAKVAAGIASRMKTAAEKVVDAYRRQGVAVGDQERETWLQNWKGRPETELSKFTAVFDKSRKNRMRLDEEARMFSLAEESVKTVIAGYKTDSLVIADSKRQLWEKDWRMKLTQEQMSRLSKRLELERNLCRAKQDQINRDLNEARLLKDYRALCNANEPVADRLRRLDDVERALDEAVVAGLVHTNNAVALRREIVERRRWIVFSVSNRIGAPIHVGELLIEKDASRLFVYTNGVPSGLSVKCDGFEPRLLSASDNGSAIVIDRSVLVAERIPVTVPELEPGVVCRIDGHVVHSGVVNLLPGSHECVYEKPECRKQLIPFKVDYGSPKQLSGPSAWTQSAVSISRGNQASASAKRLEYSRECRRLMTVEPIDDRRSRLAQCDLMLNDWKAAEILGDKLLRELLEDWRKECRKVVGVVSNLTGKTVSIGGVADLVRIEPGFSQRVDFPDGLPVGASVQIVGYDPVELPKDFDGHVFVVTDDLFTPSPVRVTVPELEDGVICMIDGRLVVGACELRPGVHTYTYRKGDCADIREDFEVKVNTPVILPMPNGWEESSSLSNLKAAFRAMNDGALEQVSAFLEAAEVQSDENVCRKRELKRQVELRMKFAAYKKEIADFKKVGMWTDAMRVYAELKKSGFAFTDEDIADAASVYEHALEEFAQKRKKCQDDGNSAGLEKVEASTRDFCRRYSQFSDQGASH